MLAPLFRNHYTEFTKDPLLIDAGEEKQPFIQDLPPRANLAVIRLNGKMYADADMRLDQHSEFQITCTYIPLSGFEAAAVPASAMAAKNIFDREVTKIDPTDPKEAFVPSLDAEDPTGNVDQNLMWQPGKFSRAVLSNPGEPMHIFQQRYRFDFMEGTAVRTGTGTTVRGAMAINELARNAVNLGNQPALLFLTITNPADFDDGQYDDWEELHSRGLLFQNLNFLAPQRDRLTGNMLITPATLQDWSRWAMPYETDAANDDRLWRQRGVYGKLKMELFFNRAPVGVRLDTTGTDAQTTAPTAAGGNDPAA